MGEFVAFAYNIDLSQWLAQLMGDMISVFRDVSEAWTNLVTLLTGRPGNRALQSCHFFSTTGVTAFMVFVTGVTRALLLKHRQRIATRDVSLDLGTAALAIAMTSVSAAIICGVAVHLPVSLSYNWVWVLIVFACSVYVLNVEFLRDAALADSAGGPLPLRVRLKYAGGSSLSVALASLSLVLCIGFITFSENAC